MHPAYPFPWRPKSRTLMLHAVRDVDGALLPVTSTCSPSNNKDGEKFPSCKNQIAVAAVQNAP
jgi:hypothetical protein